MATTPNSIITPQSVGNNIASLSNAQAVTLRNTISGTTGLTLLKGATTNGTKVRRILWRCTASNGVCLLFVWVNVGGSSYLLDEIELPAATPSTTLTATSGSKQYEDFMLNASESLYVSVTVQSSINVFAQCSDL